MTLEPHTPIRPQWTCRGCGLPWPCPPARDRLLAEFDGAPTSLGVYLGGRYTEASADLAGTDVLAAELYGRFVGWHRAALRRPR